MFDTVLREGTQEALPNSPLISYTTEDHFTTPKGRVVKYTAIFIVMPTEKGRVRAVGAMCAIGPITGWGHCPSEDDAAAHDRAPAFSYNSARAILTMPTASPAQTVHIVPMLSVTAGPAGAPVYLQPAAGLIAPLSLSAAYLRRRRA